MEGRSRREGRGGSEKERKGGGNERRVEERRGEEMKTERHARTRKEYPPHKPGLCPMQLLYSFLPPHLHFVATKLLQVPILLLEALRPGLVGNVERTERLDLRSWVCEDLWCDRLDMLCSYFGKSAEWNSTQSVSFVCAFVSLYWFLFVSLRVSLRASMLCVSMCLFVCERIQTAP